MDLHQKVHSLKYLGSISDDSTQLGTKITLLSLPSTKRLQFIEVILLILEYLQIISQTLLLYPDLFQDDNLSNRSFFNLLSAKKRIPKTWCSDSILLCIWSFYFRCFKKENINIDILMVAMLVNLSKSS